MKTQIKKKLSTSNSGVNLKKTDKKQPTGILKLKVAVKERDI